MLANPVRGKVQSVTLLDSTKQLITFK